MNWASLNAWLQDSILDFRNRANLVTHNKQDQHKFSSEKLTATIISRTNATSCTGRCILRRRAWTDVEFWHLITLIDVAALDRGDEDEAIEPLRAALNMKSESELFAFEETLSQKLYAIDGEEFAHNAGDSGGSDDGFLYARCYVVAKGREFYQAVKSDPTRMPKSIEQWCEALLYPHHAAWADQTGNDQSKWPFEATVSYESGSNEYLWGA